MRNEIRGLELDAERALYHLCGADVVDCRFAGPADGESALKETRDVAVRHSVFSLRYPVWHAEDFSLADVTIEETARAALWYCRRGTIENCRLHGIKAVRECEDVAISRSDIRSPEFGWKSAGISLTDVEIDSAYLFLDSRDLILSNVRMCGKYSFQYVERLEIRDSVLDTKDAFWHSKQVTVRNSVVKGEYLGWFSDGLTLIDCEISGTQPLCYCKNLRLENCTMTGCDLAFEYSDVQADVRGSIDSVKNPRSGRILADAVGEILTEDPVMPCAGTVVLRNQR